MRLNTPAALCLLAGAVANAIPTPQNEPATTTTTLADGATATIPTSPATDTAEASQQLDQLAEFAQAAANATLQQNSKQKRGGCSIFNVSVRREW